MIIICAGDSFTHGAELWEEKNVPGYLTMTASEALQVQESESYNVDIHNHNYKTIITEGLLNDQSLSEILKLVKTSRKTHIIDRNLERKFYSYSNVISKLLNCDAINIGISGGSQLEIISKIYSTISSVRKNNPFEKLILIAQHTSVGRVWLGKSTNASLILTSSPQNFKAFSKIDFYEIQNSYMKYYDENIQETEYDNQLLSVRKICRDFEIPLVQFFSISDHRNEVIARDDSYIIPNMSKKLLAHFGNSCYLLPLRHFNCESQELIGQWLVEEMKKQGII
jgi:hypothetical protein